MQNSSQQEQKYATKRAWAVNLAAALFFFYEFIQMNFFNAINVQLRESFGLDEVQIGQLFAMYFYGNALWLFPAGNLLDRFSTKKLLLAAVLVCTIGTFIFALSMHYWMAAFGRFLVGCGAAFCFLSCIRLASRWFPPQRMAFVTGIVVTMAMLGGLVAQTPFALLSDYIGWRHAVLVDGALGVVIIFVIAWIVADRPPGAHQEAKSDGDHLKSLGLWGCIRLAALNPQNWLGGLYTSLLNLPVFILGGLWGIRYLVEVQMITPVRASYATTVFFLGVIFGSPTFGWISDRIGRRVLPMTIGAILSLAAFLILMYTPGLSFTALIILFFIIGFVTSSQVLTYPTIAELNPIYLTSTAVSIDSITIMCSGFLFPPFFGWLMGQGADHAAVGHAVVTHSAAAFNQAMLIMPIAFVIGLITTFFIRETYCRTQA